VSAHDDFASDRQTCTTIYAMAAAAEATGDATRWPDVLAFKHRSRGPAPIVHLQILLKTIGIVDGDLVETIVKVGRAPRTSPEDRDAFANVFRAAFDEQLRRLGY
jgi:hypothetical protein